MITFGEALIYVIAFVSLYTAMFFIITLLEHRNNIRRKEETRRFPFVCIIVPCYNEEETVGKTIDSLLALDYPREKLDIIVVDDGSKDNTYKVAKKYEKKGVRVFRKPNGGKYTALNLGLSKTNAEFVGALDADSFVHPKALKRIIAYFDKPEIMAVTPSIKVYDPKSFVQKIQLIEYSLGIFFRKMYAFIGSIHVTPGPFSIYRKKFFDTYGPYKKAYLTEDIEVALRMQSHNYIIENAVNAYVYTVSPKSFKELYNQRKRWYAGFLKNIMDYKNLFTKEHGNLGLYTLPLAFVSIALIIVSLFYTLYKLGEASWKNYQYARAVNFDIFRIDLNKDLFLININTVLILGLVSVIIGVILMLIAIKVAEEKNKILFSYVLYVLAYGFLFGFWWLAVLAHNLTGRKIGWVHKKEVKDIAK